MSSHTPSGEARDLNAGVGTRSDFPQDDAIDLRDLFFRLWRGLPQIAGLGLIGLVIALAGYLAFNPFKTISTTTRVVFSFPGFEKGQYPDGAKFQADDLRFPDIVAAALRRRGFDTTPEFQSKVRAALSIEGVIPPNIVKDRDRLRAAGQTPPVYIPDEYTLTLTAPKQFPLNVEQRKQLLIEIVGVYKEHFRRTYADTPLAFGNAFSVLQNADYPDYERVFDREINSIFAYLNQQIADAKLYRSPTTNMTFSDLMKHAQLFAQVRLNETIGLIHQNGLTRDRRIAMVKLNDALRLVNVEERLALDEESVVRDLLAQAQNHEQNYVLGVKNQASKQPNSSAVLDQGVIESLLANDSYSFLVRKALDAGLKVKQVQVEKSKLLERIDNLKSFTGSQTIDQTALIAETEKSLTALRSSYEDLITGIRKTHADFSRQYFGDAIRLSDQVKTAGVGIRPLAVPSAVGLFLGLALGAGLSLLGIYFGRTRPTA